MEVDENYIRNKITELRMKKGVSEYEMSLALGQNRTYINNISSGRALPSMKIFLNICEYFDITPAQFFDTEKIPESTLTRELTMAIQNLRETDIMHLNYIVKRILGN